MFKVLIRVGFLTLFLTACAQRPAEPEAAVPVDDPVATTTAGTADSPASALPADMDLDLEAALQELDLVE